jgi:guanine nucleotide-binding protein subunit alpha, other
LIWKMTTISYISVVAISNVQPYCDYIFEEKEIKDTESFPRAYLQPLQALWNDSGVQLAIRRGNEYALYDNIH